MDTGNIVMFMIMSLVAAIAVALVVNLVAAAIGARAGVVNRGRGTLVGLGLGTVVTLTVGLTLLLMQAGSVAWAFVAYLAGMTIAYSSARGIVTTVPPPSSRGTTGKNGSSDWA